MTCLCIPAPNVFTGSEATSNKQEGELHKRYPDFLRAQMIA